MTARGASRIGRVLLSAALCGLALPNTSGCSRRAEPGRSAPSASASASAFVAPAAVASGVPLEPGVVSRVVNPLGEPAYSGPVGSVRGRVVATGDPASDDPRAIGQIGPECAPARETYGKVFREGPERALADVFIAVTGYRGYVPARESARRIEAKDCSWGTRTIGLTFGQRIDVVSKDREAYIPELLGERGQAQMVATPGGLTVSSLYPTKPGRFVLVDNLRLFMIAQVLVVKYATHAVTGLDGRYEISGIPAGNVTLSAVLPGTGQTVERALEIKPGSAVDANIELPFDAKRHRQALAALADAGAPDATATRRP